LTSTFFLQSSRDRSILSAEVKMKIDGQRHRTFIALVLGICCGLPAVASASVDDGLVARWRFTDGTAVDSSGFGNNSTISAAGHRVTGYDGTPNAGFHFDNGTPFIVPDSPSLSPTANISFSMWVKQDVAAASGVLIQKYTTLAGDYSESWVLLLRHPSFNGDLFSSVYEHGDAADQGLIRNFHNPMVNSTDVWYHLAFVYTTAFSSSMYVNGVLADAEGYLGQPAFSVFDGLAPVRIGGLPGSLDDVRFYNRALSQEEITHLATIPEPAAIGLIGFALLAGRSRLPSHSFVAKKAR